MADQAPRRPVGVPRARRTAVAALAVFLAVLALLSWQVRTGRDPALAHASRSVVVATAPRGVLVRKVIRRVIVEQLVVDDDGQVTARPVVATVAGRGPVVTSRTSAPSVAAPAPAAPAAQPAPAPIVTRTS